jgi:hypothetical protein
MDIFMEDYNRAIQFGRKRNQRIEILEWYYEENRDAYNSDFER